MSLSPVSDIREKYGISMIEAKRALDVAKERFEGNTDLGALWVHANSFAVNVKGDRAEWNDNWARAALARTIT